MRERPTARVLLFDQVGQILLMKGRLPSRSQGSSSWFTVGGGMEPGETVEAAARREVAEETGFADLQLGPVVWHREAMGDLASGERVLFVERYIVAHCAGGEPSRAGWESHEKDLIDDLRWWSLAEIADTTERIYPQRFAVLLPGIAKGIYPVKPLDITVQRVLS